jgi:hypothetical protein
MWNYTIYAALLISVLAVAAAVVHMYRSRNPVVPFGWGVMLIGVGLLAYLFSHIGAPHLFAEQIEMLRNLFIIIAGIGGNLLAGAAAAQNAHRSAAVGIPAGNPAIPVPTPITPAKVPALEPQNPEPQQRGGADGDEGGDAKAESVAHDRVHGEDGPVT